MMKEWITALFSCYSHSGVNGTLGFVHDSKNALLYLQAPFLPQLLNTGCVPTS